MAACAAARGKWEVLGDGEGVHWTDGPTDACSEQAQGMMMVLVLRRGGAVCLIWSASPSGR